MLFNLLAVYAAVAEFAFLVTVVLCMTHWWFGTK